MTQSLYKFWSMYEKTKYKNLARLDVVLFGYVAKKTGYKVDIS